MTPVHQNYRYRDVSSCVRLESGWTEKPGRTWHSGLHGVIVLNATEVLDTEATKPVERGHVTDSSERFYDTVFDSAPVMLHSIDKDGRIVKVNRRWLSELGYEESEVVGRPSVDFLTNESRARIVSETLPLFWRTGSAHSIGCQFVKRDGQVIDLLLDAELSYDAGGRLTPTAVLYRGDDLVQWRHASATIKAIQLLAGVRQDNEDALYSPPAPRSDVGRSLSQELGAPPISGAWSPLLTGREMEVLRLLATGARSKEIAAELSVTVHTVKFHIENLHKKLGVRTRAEAVRVAIERGLLRI